MPVAKESAEAGADKYSGTSAKTKVPERAHAAGVVFKLRYEPGQSEK